MWRFRECTPAALPITCSPTSSHIVGVFGTPGIDLYHPCIGSSHSVRWHIGWQFPATGDGGELAQRRARRLLG